MELDELKLQLRQRLDETSPSKSEGELTSMLKKNAQSIINKLKKSLLFEIKCGVIFTIAFAYFGLFSSHWSLRIYFSTFVIVCLLFLVVLFYLLKRMEKLSNNSLPIKNNLQAIHSIIKEYSKRSFQFTMGMIPFCLGFGLWLGFKENSNGLNFSDKILSSPKRLLILSGYTILVTVSAYYITKWYLKKLYGNYLLKLQGYINELEVD